MEIMNFCVGYMDSQEQVVHSIHYTVTVRSLTFTSGRHCCLWCHIKQGQLIEPPSVRGPVAARTIQSICEDNQKFINAGADLKDAKLYNNCICEPFFKNFPLSQVIYH